MRLSSPTEDDFQDCYPQADDDGAGQAQQCLSAEGETHYSDSAYQDYPTQYKLPNDNEYDEFEGF